MERREPGEEGSHGEESVGVRTPTRPNITDKTPRLGSSTNLEGEFLLSAMDSSPQQGTAPDPLTPKSLHTPVSLSPPKQPILDEPGSLSSPQVSPLQRGKPPLLPRTASAKAAAHRRVASAGEYLSKPVPFDQKGRLRTSSTGEYSSMSAITDPGYSSLNPGYSPLQPSPGGSSQQGYTTKKKLTLADLTTENPLETEAETAILNAIEKQSNEKDAAVVLPALPDEAIDMFQAPPTRLSQRSVRSHASYRKQDMPGDAPSVDEGRSMASRQPTLKRVIETPVSRDVEEKHITEGRVDTHEKLFVLAGEIQQIQEDAIEQEDTHREAWSPEDEHIPVTQADNLVQNCNLLFRSSRKVTDAAAESGVESEENEKTKQKRYIPFFRGGKKHPKKSDSQVADDIESGAGAPGEGDDDPGRPENHASAWQSPITAGKKIAGRARETKNAAMGDMYHFYDFLKPRRLTIYLYCRRILLWVFFPTLCLSFALYYLGNPTTCQHDGCPSWSWIFIFFFIRQVITFTGANVLQLFIIDYLSLRNRLTVKILGPTLTLLIVQSRGWPFILLMWAILDFALLYGRGEFANHWMFYQHAIEVFNAKNPSGDVLVNHWYTSILIGCIIVACAFAVKRLWMGVHLGKRTYQQYGKQLAAVMNDMLLISLLAGLAHDFESEEWGKKSPGFKTEAILKWNDMKSDSEIEDDDSMKLSSAGGSNPVSSAGTSGGSPESKTLRFEKQVSNSPRGGPQHLDSSEIDATIQALPQLQESLNSSQKIKITQLLGQFEEPPRQSNEDLKQISLSAILQFRQALSYMDDDYPFSIFFGPANTRELCVQSSQELYERLLLSTPDEADLPFTTIALVAKKDGDEFNRQRLKRLHRMFLPDADGHLSLIDFVRSIDKVYKELRLLRAAISNSSQLDEAFERVFNVFFTVVLAFIVLPIAGVDPMALILSLSGLIVGFAFMIGNASSKFFEGILFILVRKPYNIGDRIHVSQPNCDTSRDGSAGWFVEKIDLFSTTVRYATTNEVATYSNGSLAAERIINGARSPQAICYVNLKFGVDIAFAKIEVFRTTVETCVKARKREWLALIAFRATRVEADLGFIEYVLVLQHVASWQEVGAILKSKAELASYCLEVSKKLEMRYEAPPLPVNLSLANQQVADQVGEFFETAAQPSPAQSGTEPLGYTRD